MKALSVSVWVAGIAGLVGCSNLLAEDASSSTPATSQQTTQAPRAPTRPQLAVPSYQASPAPTATLDTVLAWDSQNKDIVVTQGVAQVTFTFNLTNISSEEVTITGASSSCFCTVAQLPSNPWKLAPGATGQITANMNVAGKMGRVTKTVTITSLKHGIKQVYVTADIQPAPASGTTGMSAVDREANEKIARADRQAVFKGNCVQCHVQPTIGKTGKELYAAACGICHEGDHRNQMVPNLHALAHETNAEYWKNWISYGKPGSLMPAFLASQGGILSDEQVTSLVNYLVAAIPSKPTSQAGIPAPKAH